MNPRNFMDYEYHMPELEKSIISGSCGLIGIACNDIDMEIDGNEVVLSFNRMHLIKREADMIECYLW